MLIRLFCYLNLFYLTTSRKRTYNSLMESGQADLCCFKTLRDLYEFLEQTDKDVIFSKLKARMAKKIIEESNSFNAVSTNYQDESGFEKVNIKTKDQNRFFSHRNNSSSAEKEKRYISKQKNIMRMRNLSLKDKKDYLCPARKTKDSLELAKTKIKNILAIRIDRSNSKTEKNVKGNKCLHNPEYILNSYYKKLAEPLKTLTKYTPIDKISDLCNQVFMLYEKYLLEFRFFYYDKNLENDLESIDPEVKRNKFITNKEIKTILNREIINFESGIVFVSEQPGVLDLDNALKYFERVIEVCFGEFTLVDIKKPQYHVLCRNANDLSVNFNIVIILSYIFNVNNELLSILIPEVLLITNFFEMETMGSKKMSDIRYIVMLIAIKFENFKLNLKEFYKTNKNRNIFDDAKGYLLIMNFVFDVKKDIYFTARKILKDSIPKKLFDSFFITFLAVYNEKLLDNLKIHERLYSTFLLYERIESDITSYIVEKKSSFNPYSLSEEDCSKEIINIKTNRINLEEFKKENAERLNRKILNLLNESNCSLHEQRKGFPKLTNDLMKFLNNYIYSFINETSF